MNEYRMYRMEAWMAGREEEPGRVREWDRTFPAPSMEEAEAEAESFRRAFDSHDGSGSRWLEGPFEEREDE